MKFEAELDLSLVGKATSRRGHLLALQHLAFEAGGDGVTVTGTDTDMRVSVRFPAKVQQEGRVLIPWSVLKGVPCPCRIATTKGDTAIIEGGGATVTAPTLAFDEFPLPPEHYGEPGESKTVELRELIHKTRFAVDKEGWGATDGHRRYAAGAGGHREG